MRHLLLLAIISHIFSCSSPSETKKGKAIKNDYAKGFVINQLSNGEKKLLIYHPQTGKKIDDIIIDKNKPTIVIPLSATHLSFIDALGELSTVKGVTFGESIFNPIIKEKLKSNEIVNLGQDAAPNKELLLTAKPDIIFTFPGSQSYKDQLNITEIPVTEFLEVHPLAQLEWVKVFGLVYNKYDQAVHYYDSIKTIYNTLKIQKSETPKNIMCGELLDQHWALPGGKSLINQYIEDAGADYYSFGDSNTGSTKIDFEVIIDEQKAINKWLMTTYHLEKLTREKVLAKNPKYTYLDILKVSDSTSIAVCNTAQKPYFEKGIVEPHLILKDIISFVKDSNSSNEYFRYLYP